MYSTCDLSCSYTRVNVQWRWDKITEARRKLYFHTSTFLLRIPSSVFATLSPSGFKFISSPSHHSASLISQPLLRSETLQTPMHFTTAVVWMPCSKSSLPLPHTTTLEHKSQRILVFRTHKSSLFIFHSLCLSSSIALFIFLFITYSSFSFSCLPSLNFSYPSHSPGHISPPPASISTYVLSACIHSACSNFKKQRNLPFQMLSVLRR